MDTDEDSDIPMNDAMPETEDNLQMLDAADRLDWNESAMYDEDASTTSDWDESS